jgi:hypothetical protein
MSRMVESPASSQIESDHRHHYAFNPNWEEALRIFEQMKKNVIIGMHGYCLGGCECGQPKQSKGTDDHSMIHNFIFYKNYIHMGLRHPDSINIPETQLSYK